MQFKFKKGSSIFGLLPFFIILTSCIDPNQYGRVERINSANSNLFIFSVKQEYLQKYSNSKPDDKNPKMTKAESKLLTELLEMKKYCVNKDGDIDFSITSKQKEIYDMTFAHLIEESYNARPLTPIMYYGKCVSKEEAQAKDVIKKLKDELGKLN